jgi:protein-tyrosine phosphatase
MRRGILFRSEELSGLSVNDKKTIRRLNLKLICDLRTPNEIKGKEDRLETGNGAGIINIPLYPHREDFTKQKFIHYLSAKSNRQEFENLIKEYYRIFAFEQTKQLKRIFDLISDENNLPAIIHCSVGKDRTGFISALIQLLAEIPRQDVMEDYLISNRLIEKRTISIVRFLRFMSFFRISGEKLKPMLEVRADYLDDVLDEICNSCGSVENYLLLRCGVEKASLENLKRIIRD